MRTARQKHRVILASLMVLILILSGCGKDKNGGDSQTQSGESQLQFSTFGNSRKIAESPTHYFHIQDHYLYSISKEDGKVRVVDNNPDSLDDAETDYDRLPDSNAFFYFPQSLQYVGDKLYVWANEPTEKNPEANAWREISTMSVLYEADPGGGPQKKILTIQEEIYDLLIHKGYVYFTTSDASSEIDKILSGALSQEELDALKFRVKRIPLDHPDQEAEVVYSEKGYDTFFTSLMGRGDNLYFNNAGRLATQDDDDPETMKRRAWRCDLKTLETHALPFSGISLINGGMVQVTEPDAPPATPDAPPTIEDATITNDSILLYDEAGEFKEEVALERPVYARSITYAYGDYLCQDNLITFMVPGWKRVLQIVRTDGKFIAEIEVPKEFGLGMIIGMTDQSIFIEAPKPEGGAYFEIYQVNFLETGDGKAEWEPFFTYQPPRKMVEDPRTVSGE